MTRLEAKQITLNKLTHGVTQQDIDRFEAGEVTAWFLIYGGDDGVFAKKVDGVLGRGGQMEIPAGNRPLGFFAVLRVGQRGLVTGATPIVQSPEITEQFHELCQLLD